MEKYLNAAKVFYYGKIRRPVKTADDALVEQIRDTYARLLGAYNRFEMESNEDLLDSVIYEIQSLKALYRYLIKKAQREGIKCREINVYGREVI